MRRRATLALVVALMTGGCAGPILANPPAQRPPSTPAPEATPRVAFDPQPIELPRDDGPHDRLTEWWYYTGHLSDTEGGEWGYEYVIFRAERGSFPVAWASHLALTDETGGRFTYAQRSEIGPQVDRSRPGDWAFDFVLTGADPTNPVAPGTAWEMRGTGPVAELRASAADQETRGDAGGFGIELDLRGGREPALHGEDGWIDFGPAGSSYYYSRTTMPSTGSITVGDRTLGASGTSWFDHQWGDFIAVGGGGWDWFAVNLDDGTDVTLSLVRDRDGGYPLVYGTLVDADGARHLEADAFTVEVTDRWRSPTTGADYPAGWRLTLPAEDLVIDLTPTVAHQELDARATTGVVYWEGSQVVQATRAGRALGGDAYVELTGYGL